MFKQSKSKRDINDTEEQIQMNKKQLSMTLGNNTLIFNETWQMASSELLIAAKQINELLDEKVMQNQYIEELKHEIIETNKIKTVALDMVCYKDYRIK